MAGFEIHCLLYHYDFKTIIELISIIYTKYHMVDTVINLGIRKRMYITGYD